MQRLYHPSGFFWGGASLQMTLLPEIIRSREGCCAPRPIALFITLRRFTSAESWDGLQLMLRRRRSWLQAICRSTVAATVQRYKRLAKWLDFLRIQPALAAYRDAVVNAGGLVPNVVAFVDGKALRTCRPTTANQREEDVQRVFYNGHYR